MKRHEIINWFIKKFKYKTYLEIGVDNPSHCFNRVRCAYKCGVDPNKGAEQKSKAKCHRRVTSDIFFKYNTDCYDIIFIDGLHLKCQVLRDVNNALSILNDNGSILVHDCNPPSKEVANEKRVKGQWWGTVWQAICELRATNNNLLMYTINADCGICVIKPGKQSLFPRIIDTWEDFENNREVVLNLVSKRILDEL
jgi:hypothetical protein